MSANLSVDHTNYQRIAKAIEYLLAHQKEQPSLQALAEHTGMSTCHFQRVFTEWCGVSPKQFLQYLTQQHARTLLKQYSVLESSLRAGLSSASRLHDLTLRIEAVTPGEIRHHGQGLTLWYGTGPSPFGPCFLAQTHRGVCRLEFFDATDEQNRLIEALQEDWPKATLIENQEEAGRTLDKIFHQRTGDLKLLLRGTPFRIQVWKALLSIEEGALCTYQHMARRIGRPSASRAVASAIALNPVGYLIPCHRVIRQSGAISGYRWGATRKAALIGWEQARRDQTHQAISKSSS